jgi:hypothetical protein
MGIFLLLPLLLLYSPSNKNVGIIFNFKDCFVSKNVLYHREHHLAVNRLDAVALFARSYVL